MAIRNLIVDAIADDAITGEKISGFSTATTGFVLAKTTSGASWQAAADPNPTMGGDLTGLASNAQIAADAVGTAEIATGAVGTTEIATNAVTGNEIVNGAVTELKIHSSVNLGGPSVGTNSLIRTNSQDVNEDVTISATTNGLSAGPVEVLTGWTVTVDGNWTVI